MTDQTACPAYAEFDTSFDTETAMVRRVDDRIAIDQALFHAPLKERAALIRRALIRLLGSDQDLLELTAAWFYENPSDTRRQRVVDTLGEATILLDTLEHRFGPTGPAGDPR